MTDDTPRPGHRPAVLAAARARFAAQGYHRTGLAEIAEDAGISMAHIYNFFPGKQALALEALRAECRVLSERVTDIALKADGGPSGQVAAFLKAELEQTHAALDAAPGLVSVMDMCAKKAPLAANELLCEARRGLSGILEQGRLSGALAVEDAGWTAEVIQAATIKYRFPQWSNQLPLDRLARELDGLIALILHGLEPRAATPQSR